MVEIKPIKFSGERRSSAVGCQHTNGFGTSSCTSCFMRLYGYQMMSSDRSLQANQWIQDWIENRGENIVAKDAPHSTLTTAPHLLCNTNLKYMLLIISLYISHWISVAVICPAGLCEKSNPGLCNSLTVSSVLCCLNSDIRESPTISYNFCHQKRGFLSVQKYTRASGGIIFRWSRIGSFQFSVKFKFRHGNGAKWSVVGASRGARWCICGTSVGMEVKSTGR